MKELKDAKKHFKELKGESVDRWWDPEKGDRKHIFNREVEIIAEILRKNLKNLEKKSYLEIAFGKGRIRSWLNSEHLKLLTPSTDYTGIDLNKNMIQLTKQRMNKECLEMKLIEGNSQILPVKSNHFDVVICMDAYVHFPDLTAAIKESYRVLKPGGILLSNVDNSVSFRRLTKKVADKINTKINPDYRPLGIGIFKPYTRKEYSLLLKESGFEIADIRYFGLFTTTDVKLNDKKFYVLSPKISEKLQPLDQKLENLPYLGKLSTYIITLCKKPEK